MEDVIIASGVRTAIGKFQGSLSEVSASDLGAHVIREAVSRAGIAPESVDQVIMGIVGQVAEDAYLSRHSTVKAGLPISTPAMNVNRICGSGLEAINSASRLIQSGDADVVVAGGAENMTRMPYYLRKARGGYRLGHDSIEDVIQTILKDHGRLDILVNNAGIFKTGGDRKSTRLNSSHPRLSRMPSSA